MAEELRSATDVPDISTAPSIAVRLALVIAGASRGAAELYTAPVTDENEITVYNLPAGNTVLTLALMRYARIVADNPAGTTLEVPSEATLGYTRAAGKDLEFVVQNRGLGTFTVNFTGGATLVESNNLDPSTLGRRHPPVTVSSVAANSWVYY